MNGTGNLFLQAYGLAQTFFRDASPKGRAVARQRAATEAMLDDLARSGDELFQGTVLVDGTFDNPNYWFRWSLLRRALGLANGREVGFVGEFRRRQVTRSFRNFGIETIYDLNAPPHDHAEVDRRAASFLDGLTADALLASELPDGLHPALLYDFLLKRQRTATLDVTHPTMAPLTRQAFRSIRRAREILDAANPAIVIVSHPFSVTCGSLAWIAAARGIPVVLPFGLFGMLRFTRFFEPNDLFSFYDRPTRAEIDGLPAEKAKAMADIGRTYLERRLGGKADDLAALYAFRRTTASIDRRTLCAMHGWDPEKPIVAFYASNWFDWPHQLGMSNFRDFLDWTDQTFAVASVNDRVNWLFKPHPAEDWFGGVALRDILAQRGAPAHVAIADKSWNNTSVMLAIDALVTYHGTAGVELASLGKPVLVPDRGKYEDCGFVKVASSRSEYLALLATEWWRDMDLADARRRSEIFAGWWFCAPDWQGDFVLGDDARQDELYTSIPGLVAANSTTLSREIACIADWWRSGHRYYHTSKMAKSDGYKLSNV